MIHDMITNQYLNLGNELSYAPWKANMSVDVRAASRRHFFRVYEKF